MLGGTGILKDIRSEIILGSHGKTKFGTVYPTKYTPPPNENFEYSFPIILALNRWGLYFFSHTPDRDFRCFYLCEIFISHTPVPTLGKAKKRSAARWPHVNP